MSARVTPLLVLEKARDRISDPARWTQGALARDALGEPVSETSKNAVCWCAMGAIYSSAPRSKLANSGALDALVTTATKSSIVRTNDALGHAAVLEMFDRAIANLKRK